MLPTREPDPVRNAARSTFDGPWVTRGGVVVAYVVAGGLNAHDLMLGVRPQALGMLASMVYLAAWCAYAYVFGRRQGSGALRRTAAFWAVTIGGTAICGAQVRLNLGTGAAIPGGWVAPAILLVVAAPLYGLAGWFGPDPLGVLVTVAVGAAAVIIVVALAARRVTPARRTA